MSEDQGKYTAQDEAKEALEMLGRGHKQVNGIKDESNDRKYFIITPRIVKAFARSPYDLALWDTVKEVAGDTGECYLSTEQLAALSGMSTGKASGCRKYWINIGFLKGEIRKDPGYPQPVWHLVVPDLWQKNIKWCEEHPGISDRIAFMRSLHVVKASQDEEGLSPREEGPSPRETKKIKKEEPKRREEYTPPSDSSWIPETQRAAMEHPDILTFQAVSGSFPGSRDWGLIIESVQHLRRKHGEKLTDYLTPFWTAWSSRKTKDGRPYSKTSPIWLCEWAMQGEIPQANGQEPQGNWSPVPGVDATRKMIEEQDKIRALAKRMSK